MRLLKNSHLPIKLSHHDIILSQSQGSGHHTLTFRLYVR